MEKKIKNCKIKESNSFFKFVIDKEILSSFKEIAEKENVSASSIVRDLVGSYVSTYKDVSMLNIKVEDVEQFRELQELIKK